MENKKQNNIPRDHDEEPIVIENDYLLKSELTSRVALLIFFGWLISINLTPEADSLNELYRRMALGTAIVGILWTLLTNIKMLKRLIKDKLYIKIYKDKITYDYITEKAEFKTDVLKKQAILSVKWALFPYAIKDTEIWINEIKSTDERRWAYFFSPLHIIVTIIYTVIFISINKFKIKKYLLYRFSDEMIAVPNTKNILKKKVDFEWKSLINRYILKGGYYAK